MDELRILSVCGNLGYGYRPTSLQRGLEAGPHIIGADNGSTDAGPYYLGSGEQLTKRLQVKRDLRGALVGARRQRVPLVIGSAGTAGGEPGVAQVLDIMREIAQEECLDRFRVAVIHAEVDKAVVTQALRAGSIRPLRGVPPLTEAAVNDSVRIVGQMGVEPFLKALETSADVILAGRSCDTAIYAAMPLLHGYDLGLAMHMAKIMECGAQSAIPLAANDCLFASLRRDHFLIRPLDPGRRCTPESVAAHSLYEQPDPFVIYEPGGTIDTYAAQYEQVDEQTVRISGSRWIPTQPYTIKLEGARPHGFRTITVAGVRDPVVIANLDYIEAEARRSVAVSLEGVLSPDAYTIRFATYGRDGVMGSLEPERSRTGHEVGLLLEAIAPTQELADTVLSLTRSSVLHCPFPGRKTTAGNLAFPYSPSDFRGGAVYEFSVYHLLETDDPTGLFPVELVEVQGVSG